MKLKKTALILCSFLLCCGLAIPDYSNNLNPSYVMSVNAANTVVESNNLSAHNYSTYAGIVNSYIYEDSDSGLVRVENTGDKIIVEKYSDYTNISESFEIECELEYFCGFYSGEKDNYFVFGASNSEESDDKEVLRVVKYSKEMNRISSCSIKNINTVNPSYAGSLDMTEAGGVLFIHTCHRMYKSSDGLNHQANMTFAVNEADMTCKQSNTAVSNISTGYCSHSFNQYIETDGRYIYRVDHGDAYPRGIAVTKAPVSSITDVEYDILYEFSGSIGDNQTDAVVGGLSVMNDSCITAFATYDQTSGTSDKTYNIYIAVTDKASMSSNLKTLTSYTSDDYVIVTNPYIIKYADDKSLIMWEEFSTMNNYIGTQFAAVDSNGNIIEQTMSTDLRLSDCKPVYMSDGEIKWYVTDDSVPEFNTLNPFNLNETLNYTKGDLNGDNEVTSFDALMVLQATTEMISPDYTQMKSADVSGDGKITSLDTLIILQYTIGLIS